MVVSRLDGAEIYASVAREEYGLPDSWLRLLTHHEVDNPHRRSARARLYSRAAIEELIAQRREEYDEIQARRARRREAGRRAAETRRGNEIAGLYDQPPRRRKLPSWRAIEDLAARCTCDRGMWGDRHCRHCDGTGRRDLTIGRLVVTVRDRYTDYRAADSRLATHQAREECRRRWNSAAYEHLWDSYPGEMERFEGEQAQVRYERDMAYMAECDRGTEELIAQRGRRPT
jgi:hypothetical protein